MRNTIGLFGTCDGSTWRNEFIAEYNLRNIDFFNPDAGANWHPGMIEDENRNLREDNIILFPVLGESLGLGSLGEIGFSILNVLHNIQNGNNQYLVVLIDDVCTDERKPESERKLSDKTRKLVKSKLLEVNHPNVFVVSTINDMLELSLMLYKTANTLDALGYTYRSA